MSGANGRTPNRRLLARADALWDTTDLKIFFTLFETDLSGGASTVFGIVNRLACAIVESESFRLKDYSRLLSAKQTFSGSSQTIAS